MTVDTDQIIDDIMQKHPEADWLAECQKALPNASVGYINSVFEILSGGDLQNEAEAA